MRILVTGATGQVGWELVRSLQSLGEVVGLTRDQCDLNRPELIRAAVRNVAPVVVINAAAHTAVDAAEGDEAAAFRINADAVAVIAEEAHRHGALLIHYSTDYVFDGTKADAYVESDTPAPLNVYGRSKLAGEAALKASNADWLCLRTSWVYSTRGKNFLRTVLRLAAEREELRIVSDQWGAPTWARWIADATAHLLVKALSERKEARFQSQVLHLTCLGSTSWHGFANEIIRVARELAAADVRAKEVTPISSEDYPVPARRPQNSRLRCDSIEKRFAIRRPRWDDCVRLCVEERICS